MSSGAACAGIFLYNAQNTRLTGNTIYNSKAGILLKGGASSVTGHLIRNNVLYNNTFAVTCSSGNVYRNQYINNTFFSNDSGVVLDSLSMFRNNIIWGTPANRHGLYKQATVLAYWDSIKYNDVDSIQWSVFSGTLDTTTNIKLYPMFKDTANYNFHLHGHSPCIDRGDPDTAYNDLDSSRNDMGAYGDSTAIDTIMPPRLPTTLVVKAGSASGQDSVIWSQTPVGDFQRYAIYRDTLTESFAPGTTNRYDSIFILGTVRANYPNSGKSWYYKVNAWDTDTLGGGYRSAFYGKMELKKKIRYFKADPDSTKPGDTLEYTVYYDNDNSVATVDTAELIDYLPKYTMFLDTAVCSLHTSGTKVVSWMPRNGVWTITKPAKQETVTAIRWRISPNIGGQDNTGDKTGADSAKVGVDTTRGTDSGWVRFRVRIR